MEPTLIPTPSRAASPVTTSARLYTAPIPVFTTPNASVSTTPNASVSTTTNASFSTTTNASVSTKTYASVSTTPVSTTPVSTTPVSTTPVSITPTASVSTTPFLSGADSPTASVSTTPFPTGADSPTASVSTTPFPTGADSPTVVDSRPSPSSAPSPIVAGSPPSRAPTPTAISTPTPISTSTPTPSRASTRKIVVGSAVGVSAVVLILVVVAIICKKKKASKDRRQRPTTRSHSTLSYYEQITSTGKPVPIHHTIELTSPTATPAPIHNTPELPGSTAPPAPNHTAEVLELAAYHSRSIGQRYSRKVVHEATHGFTEVLGEGAFGIVYKGRLEDGTDVAVKKLRDTDRGLQEFSAEVKTLGRINHANLVALLGFCFEQDHRYLIYEYVANGSLEKWIFTRNYQDGGYVMPWATRVSVLKGTAKGLVYLHEELQQSQQIIHLDVKPENILLNEQFVPKVADFGLAKILRLKKMTQTLAIGGTIGYMAPEVRYGAVSPKMDVYSFGVVLLEVLSGRRVLMPALSPECMFLPAWVIRKVQEGRHSDGIDPLLKPGDFDGQEAFGLILTGLLCLAEYPDERPRMGEVLGMIEGSVAPPSEVPPTLQSYLERAEQMVIKSFQHAHTAAGGSRYTASGSMPGSEVD